MHSRVAPSSRHGVGGVASRQPMLLSITKLIFLAISNLPFLRAGPIPRSVRLFEDVDEGKEPEDPAMWMYLAIAMALVLLGGAFAGLTLALMGQDEIYLEVIKTSGEEKERKHAAGILKLLKRGKHWVLVTLLLSNVITNETLPIVLDRSLGGGWPAVLSSTVLVVVFGEVIPQSVCVRYGLSIGAWMSPFVLALMYLLAPVAWPTAKLLDYILGQDHGNVYKKAGLKTLVTLHKSLGAAGEQLNADEVTIISAVLDLKEKAVGDIMTPMDDVFTMSADTILDEKTMEIILSAGYSRIPIHSPDNPLNFVGMLLVKILITYDPEDSKPVRDFALATLPETRPETSCLDIVNFFQEGKSHMVLVSEFPGENRGAKGVVTLEDVIEELIGEEIIDELDVFVDVHKAIRRMAPAPRNRVPKGEVVTDPQDNMGEGEERLLEIDEDGQKPQHDLLRKPSTSNGAPRKTSKSADMSSSPKMTFLMRRASGTTASDRELIAKRADDPELLEHLKHLGPSNLASKPHQTRYQSIKIKPGESFADAIAKGDHAKAKSILIAPPKTAGGGIGEGLVGSAGKDAKDGVHFLHVGYGSMDGPQSGKSQDTETSNKSVQVDRNNSLPQPGNSRRASEGSVSTVASLPEREPATTPVRSRTARSGSITENIIESGGITKVVLDISSGSEDVPAGEPSKRSPDSQQSEENNDPSAKAAKRRRRKKRKQGGGGNDESTPLLGRNN